MGYLVITGVLALQIRSQPILNSYYDNYDYGIDLIPLSLDGLDEITDYGDDISIPALDTRGVKPSREFEKRDPSGLLDHVRQKRTFYDTNKKFALETKLRLQELKFLNKLTGTGRVNLNKESVIRGELFRHKRQVNDRCRAMQEKMKAKGIKINCKTSLTGAKIISHYKQNGNKEFRASASRQSGKICRQKKPPSFCRQASKQKRTKATLKGFVRGKGKRKRKFGMKRAKLAPNQNRKRRKG